MPKRKKTKIKWCADCGWELDSFEKENPSMHKDNPNDVRLAKEYCEQHTTTYGSDCEPIWCEECGYLKIYQVTLTERSKNKDRI